jgi:hypothetical protein
MRKILKSQKIENISNRKLKTVEKTNNSENKKTENKIIV